MAMVCLPVRWYGGAGYYRGEQQADGTCFGSIELEVARTAFLIVDSDCGPGNPHVEEGIKPALGAARSIGVRVVYIHNDFSLCDEPGSIKREIHGTRWGDTEAAARPSPARQPVQPDYSPSIRPLPGEPDFPKREWSGFHDTQVDYHLRCWDIRNLVAVGFSQRSCLYFTLAGAVEHNYRVVMLRDCTHSAEYPDTVDEGLPEGGWLRKVMLRNFEHVIGYTSTAAQFVAACAACRQA